MTPERAFTEAKGRAKRRYGSGFQLLGEEIQRAVVMAEVLSTIGAMAAVEDTEAGRLATIALRWYGD